MTTTIYADTASTGSAWTTYVPTVTSETGTITSASATGRYKTLGKTCFFQIQIAITTAGTGSGKLRATLPVTAASTASGYGYIVAGQLANSNQSMTAIIDSGSTFVGALLYDASAVIVDGKVVLLSGVYETV